MSKFLKILKVIGFGLLGLVLIITIVGFLISEDLPTGIKGEKADKVAKLVLEELNYKAYKNTTYIGWTFAGIHSYEWYKAEEYVIVKGEDYEVKLDLADYANSKVISSHGNDDQELIESSIKNFNNDSFWLVAPYQIMRKNVERQLIENGENKNLLVTYTSGGSTPGDSYLWKLDKNYRPTSFKMWVSIIPIGGLEAQWKDWTTTASGSILSKQKTIVGLPIEITNLETKS